MDIKELREKKADLQFELRNLIGDKIIEFEKETGTTVSDIIIRTAVVANEEKYGLSCYVIEVECDLKI